MCKKNNFQILLLIAIEMAVLSVFLQKKGLGPLGVNNGCGEFHDILVSCMNPLCSLHFKIWFSKCHYCQ